MCPPGHLSCLKGTLGPRGVAEPYIIQHTLSLLLVECPVIRFSVCLGDDVMCPPLPVSELHITVVKISAGSFRAVVAAGGETNDSCIPIPR